MPRFVWGVHPAEDARLRTSTGLYGARFRADVCAWLREVARRAACGEELDGVSDQASLPPALVGVHSERLRAWGWAEEVPGGGLYTALRDFFQRPPAGPQRPQGEYWVTEKDFEDVASSFPATITAFFTVERDARDDQEPARVTFLKFHGLPGV